MAGTENGKKLPDFRVSKRLRTVAAWIKPGNVVADIGTDHGYLPIYVLNSRISEHVIAMDVRKGPLEKAAKNIQNHTVSGRIELRRSDGLLMLHPLEAQTITICGMGGRLIQRILEAGADKIDESTQLILSPQSAFGDFRKFLYGNGYEIVREEMLKEDGQYYLVIECYRQNRADRAEMLQEVFLRYGKKLLENRNLCLLSYLKREKALAESVCEKIRRAKTQTDAAQGRLKQLQADLDCIREALEYYAESGKKDGMGTTLSQLVKEAQPRFCNRIILAKVDGRLHEISDLEITDQKVEFVTTDTAIGNETYRRSAVLLMLNAIYKTAPKGSIQKVCVEYSLSKGLYCNIKGKQEVSEEFLAAVKQKMHADAAADLPIEKRLMKTRDAIALFKKYGMEDKTKLFKYRRSSYVNVYNLDGFEDYYYGYMARSTGILKTFDLFAYDQGFVLQLPMKERPEEVPVFAPQAKLFQVLKESTEWADMLSIDTVGALNEQITNGDINALILVQEALQEQKIFEIVQQIQARRDIKFVMIAGPSSSGKTTFSHRLSIQLRAKGYQPHPIAVDDYFVERENTPVDEDGNYNFEDLHAIDIDLFNRHMNALLSGQEVDMPTFNFKLGKKEYHDKKLKLGKEDILVIEGIHCLNDELSSALPLDSKFKIYISALTQLNVDEHNRVSTTDGRLIRRMVRDFRMRGASAKRTLSMWESVRRGEEKNIFPFQEEADVMFNSALAYELSVLKPYVEPLLFSIGEGEPEYQEAKRLLKFLEYFLPCGTENIPTNSILREFVGGGCFKV